MILTINLFYKYYRSIIEAGLLYVARSPFFILEKGKKKVYFENTEKKDKYLEKHSGTKFLVKRMKGIGELNPEELWETTMDPERRKLFQITIDSIESTQSLLDTFMGNDPSLRQKYIIENSSITEKDMEL